MLGATAASAAGPSLSKNLACVLTCQHLRWIRRRRRRCLCVRRLRRSLRCHLSQPRPRQHRPHRQYRLYRHRQWPRRPQRRPRLRRPHRHRRECLRPQRRRQRRRQKRHPGWAAQCRGGGRGAGGAGGTARSRQDLKELTGKGSRMALCKGRAVQTALLRLAARPHHRASGTRRSSSRSGGGSGGTIAGSRRRGSGGSCRWERAGKGQGWMLWKDVETLAGVSGLKLSSSSRKHW